MVHPLGPRPRSFFGPEDGYAEEGWRVEEYRIQEEQREWDAVYRTLSWFSRIRCHFAGEVTEPVGTSAGDDLPEAFLDLKCAVCGSTVTYCGCSSLCDHYICENPDCKATQLEILGH